MLTCRTFPGHRDRRAGTAGRGARRAAHGRPGHGRSVCRAAAGSRASRGAQRGAARWRTGRARAGPGRIPPPGRQASPCPSIRTPEAPPAHLASYRQGRRRVRRCSRCPGRRRRSRLHQYPARTRPAVRAQHDRRAVAAAQPPPWHPAAQPPPWHPAGHPGPHRCRRPGCPRPGCVGLCTAYAHAKAHGTASQKAMAFRNLAAAGAGRPRSPSTAQRCPTRAARSPASRPRPRPTRRSPPHTPPGNDRRILLRIRPCPPSPFFFPQPICRPSSAPTTH